MKKDWTDIIAEELRKAEKPLPDDGWASVQRKYAAAKRKKRKAFIAWLGGGLSAAAAIALAMVLSTSVATQEPLTQVIQKDDEIAVDLTESTVPEIPEIPEIPETPETPAQAKTAAVKTETAETAETAEGVETAEKADTADVGHRPAPAESETVRKEPFDRHPLMDTEPEFIYEDRGIPFKASLSISGSGAIAGASLGTRYEDAFPGPDCPPEDPSSPGDDIPTDSTRIQCTQYQDVYWKRHSIPVTFAVSGKFDITKTFALSASLQYSMYKSAFQYSEYDTQTRYQYAHYLGLGLRADFNIVSRKHFGLYAGIGAQTERCIYAVADHRKLNISRQSWLWSMNVVIGVEYRINDLLGIYLEPVFSGNFNDPYLDSYRTGKTLMFSGCIGLRFNL